MLVCFFTSQSLFAQLPVTPQPVVTRPVFAQLPKKFECDFSTLQKMSAFHKTDKISLQLGKLQFAGEVVEKVQRSSGVVSMNVRSSNYPGALLNISIITNANNTQKIIGRIIHPQSDEVIIITEENNHYFLVKQPRETFMTE